MAELARSAIRPLLQLVNSEARLLWGVRGDVQFISREMEIMEGFLLNLVGTRPGDHQVRALMRQVMELAYDSKNCIMDYAHSCRRRPRRRDWKGRLVGCLQQGWRMPLRVCRLWRVARRIRGLKAQVKEMGDRRQRYGVVLPTPDGTHGASGSAAGAGRRRQLSSGGDSSGGRDELAGPEEDLVRWLEENPKDDLVGTGPWPTVLAVVTLDGISGASVADRVRDHFKSKQKPSSTSSSLLEFDHVLRVTGQPSDRVLLHIHMFEGLPKEPYRMILTSTDVPSLTEVLKGRLEGTRVLLLLSDMDGSNIWKSIAEPLRSIGCSAGSAVVLFTKDEKVAQSCSPKETRTYSPVGFYSKKAESLLGRPAGFFAGEGGRELGSAIKDVLEKCKEDDYSTKLFLRFLRSNPNVTPEELKTLSADLPPIPNKTDKASPTICLDWHTRLMEFFYKGLPKDQQNCLWYLAAFSNPEKLVVRKSRLLRWWVAEGLLKGGLEAEQCFESLCRQRLLITYPASDSHKTRTCNLPPQIREITKGMTYEAMLERNQLPEGDVELHFSIRNGIELRRLTNNKNSGTTMVGGGTAIPQQKESNDQQQMKRTLQFIKSLPISSSFRLLRVLELGGYKGSVTKRHLKNICKIHQLRYLNLRDTDVVKLPKEIDRLVHLETLDIRGTRVEVLHAELPMLKHLLAGRIESASKEDTIKATESFHTVRLPRDVARMKRLEILSHVGVSDSAKELLNMGEKLQQLRKLGVVLSGKKAKLDDLFLEIDKRSTGLRSLSIRANPPVNRDAIDAGVLTLPRSLESLRICGVRGWFPAARIKQLHDLTKITLRDTYLRDAALAVLGSLEGLICLKLCYRSFADDTISIGAGQFGKLVSLFIEGDSVRSLSFAPGAAPKLVKLVWSFTHKESLAGINHLPCLRHLELNSKICDNLKDFE